MAPHLQEVVEDSGDTLVGINMMQHQTVLRISEYCEEKIKRCSQRRSNECQREERQHGTLAREHDGRSMPRRRLTHEARLAT